MAYNTKAQGYLQGMIPPEEVPQAIQQSGMQYDPQVLESMQKPAEKYYFGNMEIPEDAYTKLQFVTELKNSGVGEKYTNALFGNILEETFATPKPKKEPEIDDMLKAAQMYEGFNKMGRTDLAMQAMQRAGFDMSQDPSMAMGMGQQPMAPQDDFNQRLIDKNTGLMSAGREAAVTATGDKRDQYLRFLDYADNQIAQDPSVDLNATYQEDYNQRRKNAFLGGMNIPGGDFLSGLGATAASMPWVKPINNILADAGVQPAIQQRQFMEESLNPSDVSRLYSYGLTQAPPANTSGMPGMMR